MHLMFLALDLPAPGKMARMVEARFLKHWE